MATEYTFIIIILYNYSVVVVAAYFKPLYLHDALLVTSYIITWIVVDRLVNDVDHVGEKAS